MFIELTEKHSKEKFIVNCDHIFTVYKEEGGTMVVPFGPGIGKKVLETYEEIKHLVGFVKLCSTGAETIARMK